MAKRDSGGKQTTTTTSTTASADAPANDAMEQRILAFAEQLGRMAGTVSAKAEGWMDREALNKQITGVRDSAAELLEQLSGGVTSLAKTATKVTGQAAGAVSRAEGGATRATAAAKSKGRSGGAVDAPGKKHRKPAPKDPRAMAADAKLANQRGAKMSMKTMKTRGRG